MTDQDYINYDPFEGDIGGDVSCSTVKVVTTRKPQQCQSPKGFHHEIPAGTRARYQTALVDGDFWGRYYTCCQCIDEDRAVLVDKAN